jgi:peptide deformylase
VPNKNGTVRRFSKIQAKFQSIDGTEHSIIIEDWPARVFQHETDHTEGRLYDDQKAGRCSNLMDVN